MARYDEFFRFAEPMNDGAGYAPAFRQQEPAHDNGTGVGTIVIVIVLFGALLLGIAGLAGISRVAGLAVWSHAAQPVRGQRQINDAAGARRFPTRGSDPSSYARGYLAVALPLFDRPGRNSDGIRTIVTGPIGWSSIRIW